MLIVDNINTYYGNVKILNDISIQVNEGELISVIGANGAGKSTLLKTICGLVAPASGSISFCGDRTDKLRDFDIVKKGIVLCPEGRHVFPDLTVVENLQMGAFTRTNKKNIEEDMEKVFEMFPILKEREKQLGRTLGLH